MIMKSESTIESLYVLKRTFQDLKHYNVNMVSRGFRRQRKIKSGVIQEARTVFGNPRVLWLCYFACVDFTW